MNVSPAREQVLDRPYLSFTIHNLRPLDYLSIRLRMKFDIRECFGDRAGQRVLVIRSGHNKFRLRVEMYTEETRSNLGVFDHLQKVRAAGQQRIVDVIAQDSRKRIDVRMSTI